MTALKPSPAVSADHPASGPPKPHSERLALRRAVLVFLAFALAYFLSTLVRGIAATLAPTLTATFALDSSDLGLLGGAYFFGFSLTQLPMGRWLDRYGPKHVILSFLGVAVLGCGLFAVADNFWTLLAARTLTGVGVSACLMAPMTGYRRWLPPAQLVRCNAWMLMVGSMGLIAATLPVDALMPLFGWRPLFWAVAVCIALAMGLIALAAPAWPAAPAAAPGSEAQQDDGGYGAIWRDPLFRKIAPLGFFHYGGNVAMQTLWIVPWLTRVSGRSPSEAAAGLFWVNVSLMTSFWLWGLVSPTLARRGIAAVRLIGWIQPIGLVALTGIALAGADAGAMAWAVFCVSSTVLSLAQPALAMAMPPHLAGRALSAFNLVVFAGVFSMQWGLGLLLDGFGRMGLSSVDAFRCAIVVFMLCCSAAYLHFLRAPAHAA